MRISSQYNSCKASEIVLDTTASKGTEDDRERANFISKKRFLRILLYEVTEKKFLYGSLIR